MEGDDPLIGGFKLDLASDLWEYWGFTPWNDRGMRGVYRRVTFVKNALIGEVCRYYADDYIVWEHHGRTDRELVLRTSRPQPELMTQRFLFVDQHASGDKERIRSFLWGLRGYVEVHSYTPGGHYPKSMKDLAPLVDRALELINSKETGLKGGEYKSSPA
ncbi:MAG: hypothetical protein QM446_06725 [Synergistota bacterium]|nr:hypothetical protein [Synergistota bacterium]